MRRALGAEHMAHGLTIPLITTAAGAKFGKSAGNAVWLDGIQTSAFALHQFFLQTADADVHRLLCLLTLLPLPQIDALMATHTAHPDARSAQRALADHVGLRLPLVQGSSLTVPVDRSLHWFTGPSPWSRLQRRRRLSFPLKV